MSLERTTLQLSVGHFCVDCYSSMLGAFLPFLHRQLGISLAEAGVLGGVLILSGSLLQPVYGYLSDRLQHRVFVGLAPAVAGVFIASLGLAPNFGALLLLVLLGGAGIGMFHPQGTAMASSSDRNPGFQLSFFITSGMIGYSLGPWLITEVIERLSLERSYWAALPGVLVSVLLLWRGPRPARRAVRPRTRDLWRQIRGQLRPLLLLFCLVVLRSSVQFSLVSFLPLLFTGRGFPELASAQLLSLFIFVGGVGGFVGGTLMDRLGSKRVIVASALLYAPLLLGFLLTGGSLSILLLALGAAALFLTLPVNVTLARRLIPQGAGTVSALMMGFAWGIGGVAMPLVGVASDAFGLETALTGLVAVNVVAVPLALWVPGATRAPAKERAEGPSSGGGLEGGPGLSEPRWREEGPSR